MTSETKLLLDSTKNLELLLLKFISKEIKTKLAIETHSVE